MKQYTMTDSEYTELMEACKPVPYLIVGGRKPSSPRENAMHVWAKIAARVGCDCNSIAPANTGNNHDFMGEPLQKQEAQP